MNGMDSSSSSSSSSSHVLVALTQEDTAIFSFHGARCVSHGDSSAHDHILHIIIIVRRAIPLDDD